MLDAPDGGAALMKRYADRVDCIAVGGGDGTLIRAIPGVLASKRPMGIVPLGTFNDLAKTLGIPLDPPAAVETIVSGKQRALDVGRVGDRYFLNEASVGISTHIARRQTPALKKRFGFLGVIGTTLQTLRFARPFRADVRYDGAQESFRTLQLTIANSHHFGGFITNDKASIDDGNLDLYSLDVKHWTDVFSLIRPIATHKISDSSSVQNRRAKQFEVHTRQPRPIYTDGEPACMTPATFEVLPAAIRVFVPSDEAKKP
ncbi:MAG: lipid kinase [Vulcanimicrobiaceae bacterium]